MALKANILQKIMILRDNKKIYEIISNNHDGSTSQIFLNHLMIFSVEIQTKYKRYYVSL